MFSETMEFLYFLIAFSDCIRDLLATTRIVLMGVGVNRVGILYWDFAAFCKAFMGMVLGMDNCTDLFMIMLRIWDMNTVSAT
jgi:hypothetical protein